MKLRQAIKIQRIIEEPWRNRFKVIRHRYDTVHRSRAVCNKRSRWRDDRIPYIPTEEELTERAGFALSILGDCLIDDEADREEFKDLLWTALADADQNPDPGETDRA